ncbi:MAG TPA: helix-hairpin-helix domain-containing protein [Bacteroidia bacterium]|nr:helix-hairpin-helix domain-containing protein [Bacteroidia bacterium]
MKFNFKDFFNYNKRERNGIFILLSIIALLLIYLAFSDNFIHSKKINFSDFDKQITAFQESQKQDSAEAKNNFSENENHSEINQAPELFIFNPNTATETDWKTLGVADKEIKIIQNYLAKGGHFYKKEDLKKIYGFSEKQYLALADYISIPSKKNNFQKHDSAFYSNNYSREKNNFETKKIISIEINAADSLQLLSLRGIGPYFAHKILEYRNRLGGFYNTHQLFEIYHFDSTRFDEIKNNILVDTNLIQKININMCTSKQLRRLPYINYNLSNSIVNFRLKHGNYKQVSDIQQSVLMNGEVYEKIKPYLSVK